MSCVIVYSDVYVKYKSVYRSYYIDLKTKKRNEEDSMLAWERW